MKRVVLQYEYTVSLFNMVIKEYKYIFPYDGLLTAQIMRGLANIRTITTFLFVTIYTLRSEFLWKKVLLSIHMFMHTKVRKYEKKICIMC